MEKIKYTRETLPMNEVPEGINTYLDKNFSNDVVFGITKEGKEPHLFYVIEVEHNGAHHHVKFDVDGNYVSERKEIPAETEEEHFTTLGGGD